MTLDALLPLALDAGTTIMAIYADMTPDQAAVKGDGSPVTVADEQAEAVILAGLARLYPDVPVVAEESVAAGRVPATSGGRFFLVDPLDGTKEFITRNGEFTVNIALIAQGVPVLGIVYAPALGLIYGGAEGQGARQGRVVDGKITDWQPIAVRPVPAAGVTVVASRSHLTPETQGFIDRFPVGEFLGIGSSLKFCKVAAGEADLYPRLGRTMEWDTAAGDAVLRAAGGGVFTLDGRPLAYGKRQQAEDSDFANPWFVAAGPLDPFAA